MSVVVAYVAAALYAVLFTNEESLRSSGLGGALAALFLIAQPAYTVGAAFSAAGRTRSGMGAPALFGAAAGVLVAATMLIPNFEAGVIFVLAASTLLAVALIETRRPQVIMNANEFSLNGKKAIVTGVGDRGQVGYAVAERLIAAGARVFISGLKPDVADLARELGAESFAADLTSETDVAALIANAHEKLGGIDLLVNVAGGLSVIKPVADTSFGEWEREIRRNAETVFLMCRAALPHLRESRGTIINFASPAGERAVAQLGVYSAAKAAVIALTRAIAVEEKANGVRVNALAPGMIDTEQNRATAPADAKWVSREQIANTVVFLASDAASAITGETIHVLGEGIE